MADTLISVVALLAMASLFSKYHRESTDEPAAALPFQSDPNVKRWKHNGQQPRVDTQGGNTSGTIDWPEVDDILPHL